MATIKKISDGIEKQLQGYVQRANAIEGYLKTVVVEQYRNIQRERWMTENASEGTQWTALNPTYAARKKVAYKSFPGAGSRMMVATNKLFKSVIGPGEGFRMVTTPRSLTIATAVDYAAHANEARTFTTYSSKSITEIRLGIKRFIINNDIRMARAF